VAIERDDRCRAPGIHPGHRRTPLLFRGRYLTHWRDRLPEGYTSSSILFHFIEA